MFTLPLKPTPGRSCQRVDLCLATFENELAVARLTCTQPARFLLVSILGASLALCGDCYREYLKTVFGRN